MGKERDSPSTRQAVEGSNSYPDTGESGDSYDMEIGSVGQEISDRMQAAPQISLDRIVDIARLNEAEAGQ